jgi:cupin 2 domain-containing protein
MLVNLFDALPADTAHEAFDEMLNMPGLRIERIVSHGQSSPAGFWYEQPWDEWVIVLKGEARLQIQGQEEPLQLRAGDHCWLPAGRRHRVISTSHDGPTIWLAVHRQVSFAPKPTT